VTALDVIPGIAGSCSRNFLACIRDAGYMLQEVEDSAQATTCGLKKALRCEFPFAVQDMTNGC